MGKKKHEHRWGHLVYHPINSDTQPSNFIAVAVVRRCVCGAEQVSATGEWQDVKKKKRKRGR